MKIAFSFLSLLNNDYESSIRVFNNFGEENWIHYDVMDGKFVSNKTYSERTINKVMKYNTLFNDVHLMISDPQKSIKKYIKTGADQITFHVEALPIDEVDDLIYEIKSHNIKAGLSIKPDTDVLVLNDFLPMVDFILVMSVEPGKGGQKFLDSALDKIRYLKEKQAKYGYVIGVDGGINEETAKLVREAGADVAIVGSYLAKCMNYETLEKLK